MIVSEGKPRLTVNLNGKTALVTGGARRLGRAICLALGRSGANVIVHHDKSAGEAESLVAELRDMGVQAWTVGCDLASSDDLSTLISRAQNTAGSLSILVNNASIFPTGTLDKMTREDLDTNISVNAWAPLMLARDFVKANRSGQIVNIVDSRVTRYDFQHAAYHASKVLLELFNREMAISFAPDVTVNAVAPGLIMPPEGKDESYMECLKGRTLLNRVGCPEDVTDAVLFLLSSDYITGQIIYLDGGRNVFEPQIG